MRSRNAAFIRSVAFAAVTKFAGAFIVFVGLPLIAHALSIADYALFLEAMSAASLVTLVFGAAGALALRDLARAAALGTAADLRTAESRSSGLFLVLAAITSVVAALVVAITPGGGGSEGAVLLCATFLALVQGSSSWGEICRVALRTDHLASLWRLASNVLVLLVLIGLALAGALRLWPVVLIYFGIPALFQVAVVIHLWRERLAGTQPDLTAPTLLRQMRDMVPIAANSVADYAKVFGSGLVVGALTDNAEYARYTTIILLAARLVNPLSLISRPLMPAYLDAVRHEDLRWLRALRAGVAITAAGSLAAVVVLGASVPAGLYNAMFPSGFGDFSPVELTCALLFLWGQGFMLLVTPFYYATGREMLLASVNGMATVIALVLGGVATLAYGSAGMLVVVGVCVALAATALVAYVVARLTTGATPAIVGMAVAPVDAAT